jgi:hypothetical protein
MSNDELWAFVWIVFVVLCAMFVFIIWSKENP